MSLLNRRMMLGNEEVNNMRETYCYEELFRTMLTAGQELKLNTSVTYADIKKYATVQLLYRCVENNPVQNVVFTLGDYNLSRFRTSGHLLILDNRDKDMIKFRAISTNQSLLRGNGVIDAIQKNLYYYVYDHQCETAAREIEKINISDTLTIGLDWMTERVCKVNTEIIITGLTKYV